MGTNKGSYGNVASRPLEHKLLESPMKPTSRHSYSRFAPFVKGIVEFVPACTVQWQPSACSWGRTRRGFSVWNVLEVRCKDLIQADQAERDLSVYVPGQTSVPQSVQNYQSSQTDDLLAWKKTSKMVPTPVTASSSGRLLEACQGTDNMPPTPLPSCKRPLGWWKQHGHLFPTLSRLARRYLAIPLRRSLLNVVSQSQVNSAQALRLPYIARKPRLSFRI